MSDFGTPVAQNVQPPSLQSLSTLMGLRGQQLQQQQQQQNLDKGAAETQMTQQNAQQRAAVAGVDWSKYDDGTGTISTDKMLGDAGLRKAAGDSFLDVVKQGAAMRGVQLQNKQQLANLTGTQLSQFGATLGALRTDPDVIKDNSVGRQKVTDAITQFGQAFGPDAAKVAQIYAPVAIHAPQDKLARGVSAIQLQAMDVARQAEAQAPSYASTGQVLTNIKPQAAGGNLEGSPDIQQQIPPGATVIDPKTGQPMLRGPQPAAPAGAPQVATGLAPGAAGNLQSNYDEMNRHFASLQDTSSGAPLVGALTGNIKALAKTAVTGTESDRKAYLNGLLNSLGVGDQASGDTQKDTDLLGKQLAQLNLSTPASSDAARALVGAARPNSHMSASAIADAADQIASQIQANMAIRNKLALSKFANSGQGDPGAYQAQRQQLEQVADPRAWQYMRLGPGTPAAKAFTAKLTPADRAQLGANIHVLEQAGMLQ